MTTPHEMPIASAEEEAHHPLRARACNKAKMLLKWFLLNSGDLFSVEQLGNLLWPNVSMKTAVANLHVTIHYLRHVLEPELPPSHSSTFIRRNRHNYYWFEFNDVWWTDVLDIQYLSTLRKEAERSGDISRAIALSNQLVSYYSLEFLPEDIYEDIFLPYRRQHDYAYTQLLEHLMQLYTQTNQFGDALSCALRILAVDPYNENAVKTMVHTYVLQGNTISALRQLDDFQRFLKEDMGIEPGKEILALRNTILQAH